jgi:hypothetical protein
MTVECIIPSWFETVNDWWLDNIIDTDMFYNALNWLLREGIASCKDALLA